jgi:hypothetical protein
MFDARRGFGRAVVPSARAQLSCAVLNGFCHATTQKDAKNSSFISSTVYFKRRDKNIPLLYCMEKPELYQLILILLCPKLSVAFGFRAVSLT